MSRRHWRYEDLPAHLQAQVDALTWRLPAEPAPAAIGDCRTGDSRAAGRSPRGPRQPNKTEAAYRAEVLGRRTDLAAVLYEALTLRMANGHRYTPDWVVVTNAGRIECHEVKGGYALPSHQRARLAFDQVRVEFPWIVWVWVVRVNGGWSKGGY